MIVGISTFLSVVEISCNRIACGIGGGACCWGEAGCWRVTFFSLRGLLLVGAVQSSPCSGKTGQKGRFRVCWESFVPVGPARPMCRESFVPVGPPNWIRQESFVPVGLAGGVCRESFVPVGPPNWIRQESFVPVGLAGGVCRESFVPAPAPRAVQSSPCLVWWWANARNSSPSARKMAQNRRFVACWASFFAKTL